MKKNVVIIILAILVLGLGGYLVYDKVLSGNDNEIIENNEEIEDNKEDEKNDNEVVDNNEVIEESYDVVAAEELIEKYYASGINEGNIFTTGYTDSAMKNLAVENIAFKDLLGINCVELYANNDVSEFFPEKYEVKLDNGATAMCDINGTAKRIDYDTLSESYKKLFGNDKVLSKSDFNYDKRFYDYNELKNSFIILSRVMGLGGHQEITMYGVQSASKLQNKLIVNVGMSQLNLDGANWITTISGENIAYSNSDVYNDFKSFKEEFLNKYLNKLDTYIFTFFEEDGVYKLESMVKE